MNLNFPVTGQVEDYSGYRWPKFYAAASIRDYSILDGLGFVGEGQGVATAPETREGAGGAAEGGDAGLAASFPELSFFGPVVLSEFLSAAVGLSLSE